MKKSENGKRPQKETKHEKKWERKGASLGAWRWMAKKVHALYKQRIFVIRFFFNSLKYFFSSLKRITSKERSPQFHFCSLPKSMWNRRMCNECDILFYSADFSSLGILWTFYFFSSQVLAHLIFFFCFYFVHMMWWWLASWCCIWCCCSWFFFSLFDFILYFDGPSEEKFDSLMWIITVSKTDGPRRKLLKLARWIKVLLVILI